MIRAGEFEATVEGGGYPVCTNLYYQGELIARFNHREVSDLRYVMDRVALEVRSALHKDAKEEILIK